MKKKNVFLAKVFAVALAASMAFSTPYASAALVTETTAYEGSGSVVCTQNSPFFNDHGDFYRLSGDFDVTFELTNKSNGATIYNNFVVVLSTPIDYTESRVDNGVTPGYSEYMVMRADGYGWNADGNTNDGAVGTAVSDWDRVGGAVSFQDAMMDAKATVNATRSGDDFVFKISCLGADNVTYNSTFNFTAKAEKDVNIFFTGEMSDVNILSYTVNSGNVSADGNNTQSPDTASDGAIDTTPDNSADQNQAPAPDDSNTDDIDTNDTDTDTDDTNIDDTDTDDTDIDDTDIGGDTDDDTNVEDDNDTDADDEAPAKKTVKLNKKKATVKVGKSVKLKVKNTSKKVTWSSSNKKVAKVNKSGKVTGVKTGKATIKAKVGKKTLKCKVTVKK